MLAHTRVRYLKNAKIFSGSFPSSSPSTNTDVNHDRPHDIFCVTNKTAHVYPYRALLAARKKYRYLLYYHKVTAFYLTKNRTNLFLIIIVENNRTIPLYIAYNFLTFTLGNNIN
jgi:hypothetical protein